MMLTFATLLAASIQIDAKPTYSHDFDRGCIVYATLADYSGAGSSSMREWLSVESWCGGIMGTPSPNIVSAELFMHGINQDKVRDWTVEDMDGTFRLLDVNRDGVIEKEEITALSLAGEAPVLAQAFVRRTARLLLLETADVDRDGVVSVSERADLLRVWTQAQYKSRLARVWIEGAKLEPVGRWSAISPGASFAAFEASLDQEGDGHRIDWLRMEAWFYASDANGDRALDSAELYASSETEWGALSRARLANEANTALLQGDVDGAVQRLVALAKISPESFTTMKHERTCALDTASKILAIALPSESQPMLQALRQPAPPLPD